MVKMYIRTLHKFVKAQDDVKTVMRKINAAIEQRKQHLTLEDLREV